MYHATYSTEYILLVSVLSVDFDQVAWEETSEGLTPKLSEAVEFRASGSTCSYKVGPEGRL